MSPSLRLREAATPRRLGGDRRLDASGRKDRHKGGERCLDTTVDEEGERRWCHGGSRLA